MVLGSIAASNADADAGLNLNLKAMDAPIVIVCHEGLA